MKVIIEGEKRYIESILKANKGRIRRGLVTVDTPKEKSAAKKAASKKPSAKK